MPVIVIEIDVDANLSESVTSVFVQANRDVADNTFGGSTNTVTARWKDPSDPRILHLEP